MWTQLSPFRLNDWASPVCVVLLCRAAWSLSDLLPVFNLDVFAAFLPVLVQWLQLPGRDVLQPAGVWRCCRVELGCALTGGSSVSGAFHGQLNVCCFNETVSNFGNSQGNLFTYCMRFLLFRNFSTFLLSPFLFSWWRVLFCSPQIRGCFCLNCRIKLVRTVLSGGFCARRILAFI